MCQGDGGGGRGRDHWRESRLALSWTAACGRSGGSFEESLPLAGE